MDQEVIAEIQTIVSGFAGGGKSISASRGTTATTDNSRNRPKTNHNHGRFSGDRSRTLLHIM